MSWPIVVLAFIGGLGVILALIALALYWFVMSLKGWN